jgi:hypothetical protein
MQLAVSVPLGFVVKYTSGEHANKFWGKDHYGRWIVSVSPFVFTEEKDADRAVEAPETVSKVKLAVFVAE